MTFVAGFSCGLIYIGLGKWIQSEAIRMAVDGHPCLFVKYHMWNRQFYLDWIFTTFVSCGWNLTIGHADEVPLWQVAIFVFFVGYYCIDMYRSMLCVGRVGRAYLEGS